MQGKVLKSIEKYHGVGYVTVIVTKAAATISLSATGSRNAPKGEVT